MGYLKNALKPHGGHLYEMSLLMNNGVLTGKVWTTTN